MSTAILIPCWNEEATIGKVVRDFAAALPQATIYVYDNNSTDRTREVAAAAGAIVRQEPLQGKGYVIRRMFAEIDADVYIMVDGDDTYDAASAPAMVERLLAERLDVVNGVRVAGNSSAYPRGRRLGNAVFTGLVRIIFGIGCSDVLTGYRAFSAAFVKSFSRMVTGFEIEVALTVHALTLHLPAADVKTPYKERPPGSESKLRTLRDGFHIFRTVLRLAKEERPLRVFGFLALLLALAALALAFPVLGAYGQTGIVPQRSLAVAAGSSLVLSVLSLALGWILKRAAFQRQETARRCYLQLAARSSKNSCWRGA